MKLVEKHLIKTSKQEWREIDSLCFLSKNLYNCAIYQCRQAFFRKKTVPSFNQLYHLLKITDDYKSLPAKVSQLIIKQVAKSFKSYFAALRAYSKDISKFLGKPQLPRYKHKTKGRNILTYNYQAVSKKALKQGLIQPSGTSLSIQTKCQNINEVRVIPSGGSYVIEVVYEVEEVALNKCSFFDLEPIHKQTNYLGKRVRRGLFRASNGRVYNGDSNGSLNCIRNAVGDSVFDRQSIKRLVVSPVRAKPYQAINSHV